MPLGTFLLSHTINDAVAGYEIEFTLNYGSGETSGKNIYFDSKCREDFSDVRFAATDGSGIWFWLENITSGDTATCWVTLPGSGTFTIGVYYGSTLTGNEFKFAPLADLHYDIADFDPGATGYYYMSDALDWMDHYVTRMNDVFKPDMIALMGDNIQAWFTPGQQPRTKLQCDGYMHDVMVKWLTIEGTTRLVVTGDHEHGLPDLTIADVRTRYSEACECYETDRLYGSVDVGDYHFIILDGNYRAEGDVNEYEHAGDDEQSFEPDIGQITDGTDGSHDQIAWLRDDLVATRKKTIVLLHHQLFEYIQPHTGWVIQYINNHEEVRQVLEDSGKVIAVFSGHGHRYIAAVVNGIPYIQLDCFCLKCPAFPLPYGEGNDRGRWYEVTINDARKEIKIDLFGDDTAHPQVVRTHYLYYGYDDHYGKPSNPFQTFAWGWDQPREESSFNSGELATFNIDVEAKFASPEEIADYEALASDFNYDYQSASLPDKIQRIHFEFPSLDDAETNKVIKSFVTELTGRFRILFKIRFDEVNKRHTWAYMDVGQDPGPFLDWAQDGKLYYHNGGGWVDTGETYSAGTDYDIEVRVNVDTDTFDLLIGGAVIDTGYAFSNAVASLYYWGSIRETGVNCCGSSWWITNIRLQQWVV